MDAPGGGLGDNSKQIDRVKESIADIIGQLGDIGPGRFSFSPFIDTDTQVSLASVSESVDSSMSEPHSMPSTGSPCSPAAQDSTAAHAKPVKLQGTTPVKVPALDNLPKWFADTNNGQVQLAGGDQVNKSPTVNGLLHMATLHRTPVNTIKPSPTDKDEVCIGPMELDEPHQDNKVAIPTDMGSISLLSMTCSKHEELSGNRSRQAAGCAIQQGPCQCCLACAGLLTALLVAACLLYTTYEFLPYEAPLCSDIASRLAFGLRCAIFTLLPSVLGMVAGGLSQLCRPVPPRCSSGAWHIGTNDHFVADSTEHLTLYLLNLLMLATYLQQQDLKVLPMLVGLFVIGRLLYWFACALCPLYRSFGAGLTFFPTLGMMVYNLYCLLTIPSGLVLPLPSSNPEASPSLRFWG
uniref:transmembrane protein 79-like n=1 Tax=Myxine glutinosa TaxID=7769 RepID=UPI00358FD9DA